MMLFSLICDQAHEYEAWFDSNDAFDKQKSSGYVSCPYCGSAQVEKQLMTPSLGAKGNQKVANDQQMPPNGQAVQKMLTASNNSEIKEMIKTVRKMRKTVKENADNVGDNFAEEARKIHYKEAPARGIYGQTTPKEAKELIEEGVDVMPLPSLPEDGN